ncbi:CBS domain-containing protein [Thermodesulfobacterium sp. TA1]|uniref:CBS and ACT domain-containing protein n=1 Tax=Thermodesulfobacterium sp. TA1 TaxID=2234087 RepID=UPI00123274F9|nr:CBS and ACT domain-containing protein [Thermodesulfobacterium sp. TA1]QER42878.1 CBS domain-containing protein [Thermodesulfobacterium sp. TA1]
MLVKDWMTEPVITLEEDEPVTKAIQLLKQYKIRRIPITKEGKLVGIITHTDLKEATPPQFAGIDLKELYELFLSLKVKDIMTPNPITVSPEDTIERASILMLENKISGLPVVNENLYVIGIITQVDIFKLFVQLTGAYFSPYHVALYANSLNAVPEILEIFRNLQVNIYTIFVWRDELCIEDTCKRRIFIRFQAVGEQKITELLEKLGAKFQIVEFKKDDISNISPKPKEEKNLLIF